MNFNDGCDFMSIILRSRLACNIDLKQIIKWPKLNVAT